MPDTAIAHPRQRVLDAALECFSRAGFHGASMGQICTAAGMSPGAVYRYFPSKVSIIEAIVEGERARHAAFFDGLASADDPVEALSSLGVDALADMLAGPTAALCAETMAEAIRNPEIRAIYDRAYRDTVEAMTAALRRGQAQGRVDPGLDVQTACQLMLAMSDGLTLHRALDPDLTATRFRPVLQQLLQRLFRPA